MFSFKSIKVKRRFFSDTKVDLPPPKGGVSLTGFTPLEIRRRLRLQSLTGFTLLELSVVIVIIGILASLAIPIYIKAVERTRNREAQAMLRLIQQAQRMYRLEVTGYVACANNNQCNSRLRLNLPSGTNRAWDYNVGVNNSGGAGVDTFTATGIRRGSDGRIWRIIQRSNQPDQEPTCSGGTYCE